MEDARKQLEMLKILKDNPHLLKRIEELELKNKSYLQSYHLSEN